MLPYIQLLTYDGGKYTRPISTLPMLKGKLYLITCPTLAQSVFNSPDLCLETFLVDFSTRPLLLSAETPKILEKSGHGSTPSCREEASKADREAFQPGVGLVKMILASLISVAFTINSLGHVTEPKSMFDWLRQMIALDTSKALFGAHGPLKENDLLVDALR
jgi:hypothetical protein